MEANYPAARVTRLVGSEKNTVYTKPSYLASTNHMSVLKWATITHQMKTLCNKIKIQNPSKYSQTFLKGNCSLKFPLTC